MKEQMYTIRQAAPILGRYVRTVRWYVQIGKLKAEKRRNVWYIPESEIERIKHDKPSK